MQVLIRAIQSSYMFICQLAFETMILFVERMKIDVPASCKTCTLVYTGPYASASQLSKHVTDRIAALYIKKKRDMHW